MTQDLILGTDTGVAALVTKVNGDMTELFLTQTEVVNARTSTVAATVYASVDARLEAIEGAASALASGSGVIVSANDTTVGVLNGKLVGNADILLTENNDGGNETLTLSLRDTQKMADIDALIFFNGLAF